MQEELTVDDLAALFNEEAASQLEDDGAQEATPENEEEILVQDDPDLGVDVEDAAETPSGDDVEDEGSEEAEGPIQAPEFWNAEYKAQFANLPVEAQKLVAEQAQHGTAAIAKALNEAANIRKAAENQAKNYTQRVAELDQLIPQAKQNYASRWGNISPEQWALAFQQDPIEASKAKALYEAETAQLQRLEAHKAQADQDALRSYRAAELATLRDMATKDSVAKQLVNPSDNSHLRAVGEYLLSQGFPKERLDVIGAKEMVIAEKARLYDKLTDAQKAAKPAPKQPAAQNSPAKGMRPPATSGKPQYVSRLDQQRKAVAQGGSIDAFAKLFEMEERARK